MTNQAVDFGVTSEEKKRILHERAVALARETEEEKAQEDRLEVIEFFLADERYGVELSYVKEVYPLKEFTILPCTPAFVFGLVNVRGQLVSVVDIKKFFDLPERGLSNQNKIIIVHNDKIEMGIRADEVVGVRKVPVEEIQTSFPTLTGVRAEYLKGVTDDMLIILDMDKLLNDENIIINEEI